MSLSRRLEAELLDRLPAEDPRAIRSRRDLTRVNAMMNNVRAMASALRKHAGGRRPGTLVDLGCGDGRFMLRVAHRLAPHWPGMTVILQDRQNIVSKQTRDAFTALGWHAEPVSADVFEFLDDPRSASIDVVTANLFLHHFTEEQLRRLFANAAQRASLLVACEPRRAKLVVELSRLLWMVGCNDVTVHDAVASARAGFAGRELSALWPIRDGWQLREHASALFTHCLVARRLTAQARSNAPPAG